MTALGVGAVVFACVFAGALFGMFLGSILPKEHLSDNAKDVKVLGDPDAPRSWSYTGDVARTLIACADDERAWGRPWHAVVQGPLSQRQAVDSLADVAGVPRVAVSSLPTIALRLAGLFSTTIREVREVGYQFQRPFVCDDSATREVIGLSPTAWREVARAVVDSFGAQRLGARDAAIGSQVSEALVEREDCLACARSERPGGTLRLAARDIQVVAGPAEQLVPDRAPHDPGLLSTEDLRDRFEVTHRPRSGRPVAETY